MIRLRPLSVICVTAGVLAVSCGSDTTKSQQGSTLTITARDYHFDVQGEAKAGVTTIDLVNRGKEPHMVVMAKLKKGKSASDLLSIVKNGQPPDPAAAAEVLDEPIDTFHGQPGVTLPGDSVRTITTALTPGTYAILCPIPNPQHEVHAGKGMLAQLVVQPGDSKAAVATDGEISIEDGNFKLPPKLGNGTYKVVNDGKEPHELTVGRLEGNATVQDVDKVFGDYFKALFGDQAEASPVSVPTFPARVVGGFLDTLPPGATGYLVLKDMKPGRYAVTSESDDNNNTKFHADFTVK